MSEKNDLEIEKSLVKALKAEGCFVCGSTTNRLARSGELIVCDYGDRCIGPKWSEFVHGDGSKWIEELRKHVTEYKKEGSNVWTTYYTK